MPIRPDGSARFPVNNHHVSALVTARRVQPAQPLNTDWQHDQLLRLRCLYECYRNANLHFTALTGSCTFAVTTLSSENNANLHVRGMMTDEILEQVGLGLWIMTDGRGVLLRESAGAVWVPGAGERTDVELMPHQGCVGV